MNDAVTDRREVKIGDITDEGQKPCCGRFVTCMSWWLLS